MGRAIMNGYPIEPGDRAMTRKGAATVRHVTEKGLVIMDLDAGGIASAPVSTFIPDPEMKTRESEDEQS